MMQNPASRVAATNQLTRTSTEYSGDRVVGDQLRVARQELVRLPQPRRVGAVCHVEQHSEDPGQHQYDV